MANSPKGRSRFGNFMREAIDRAFLHNRGYDNGQWNRDGVRQGLIQTGLGMINPAAGAGYGLYLRYRDRHPSGGQNGGPISQTPLTPQQIPFNPQYGSVSYTPNGGTGAPPSSQPPSWQNAYGGGFGGGYAGAAGFAGMPQRQIGGTLSFGNGHFNNGAGAGTGYGASNVWNDSWGDAARGFGIGSGGVSGPSSYAVSDALRAAALNRV